MAPGVGFQDFTFRLDALPAPEPGTLGLLGLGLLALAARGRRPRTARAAPLAARS